MVAQQLCSTVGVTLPSVASCPGGASAGPSGASSAASGASMGASSAASMASSMASSAVSSASSVASVVSSSAAAGASSKSSTAAAGASSGQSLYSLLVPEKIFDHALQPPPWSVPGPLPPPLQLPHPLVVLSRISAQNWVLLEPLWLLCTSSRRGRSQAKAEKVWRMPEDIWGSIWFCRSSRGAQRLSWTRNFRS